jgi:hypothetical protein
MGATVAYDQDQRLTITGIDCHCGLTHCLPTQDIYVGQGLLPNVPRYIQKRGLGTCCVLVADQNTWALAGE